MKDKTLVVRGVELRDDVASEVFHHVAAGGEDLALQLRELGNALATALKGLELTTVVVRSADRFRGAGIKEHAALRMRGEGVLLSTARASVDHVECLSGKAIGDTCGKPKADIDADASQLLSEEYKEAMAAALAADRLRLKRFQG